MNEDCVIWGLIATLDEQEPSKRKERGRRPYEKQNDHGVDLDGKVGRFGLRRAILCRLARHADKPQGPLVPGLTQSSSYRQARVTRAPITFAMRRPLTGPREADHHDAPNAALRDLAQRDAWYCAMSGYVVCPFHPP